MITSRTPCAASCASRISTIVRSPIGMRGFGMTAVYGLSLEPLPPARRIAFIPCPRRSTGKAAELPLQEPTWSGATAGEVQAVELCNARVRHVHVGTGAELRVHGDDGEGGGHAAPQGPSRARSIRRRLEQDVASRFTQPPPAMGDRIVAT